MKIKEIMTRNVEVVRPDDTLRSAAEKMKALDVGSLPVSEGDQLVGVLTDRDITVRAVAQGADPNRMKVREAMTAGVACCFDHQDVNEAARMMKEKQIRRLPIMDRDRRIVGIVSLGDVALECRDEPVAGEILEKVSEPTESTLKNPISR